MRRRPEDVVVIATREPRLDGSVVAGLVLAVTVALDEMRRGQ